MEKPDDEKGCGGPEDACSLSRNRSFKSKQLVRSQAIRESQSPPRTSSPAVASDSPEAKLTSNEVIINYREVNSNNNEVKLDFSEVKQGYSEAKLDYIEAKPVHNAEVRTVNVMSDGSSHTSDELVGGDKISDGGDDCKRRQQVEIQITPGAWESEPQDQRQRTRRWLGQRQLSRDLLSNNPRVACVCGACHACPHCRGRRRRPTCPTKQDSGIACSADCPDCGPEGGGEARSIDADEPAYCRCPERKEKPKSISLSRTDSDDKSEPTGQDLVNFIKETLNKNGRDRVTLLKIERELHSLINDTGRCIVRFPVMTSYGRMLVHRCASLFELSHHLDQTNKTSVMVSKSGTSGGRIPCTPFKQWCTANFPPSPQRAPHQPHNAKSILKRATHSLDSSHAGALSAARSKSLEQREREYERVRRRIFSSDNCTSQDESQWPWLSSGPVKLLTPDSGRNKLLKVHSLETSSAAAPAGRGVVSKSHSFGGYGGAEPPAHPARLLSRQGDLASSSWRLSPSSSGYRTLSLHSADSVTPSPTGGASPEPTAAGAGGEGAVVWAVTDLSAVPAGAVVIHPQTGRALTNPDGSIYHFDPAAPPALCGALYSSAQHHHKTEQNCEKRRGRLEKQHSFIDSECECPVSEECRSKCCCECGRQRRGEDKAPTQDQKPKQSPPSPCKNHYEHTVDVPANHSALSEPTANHRTAYDASTNHTTAYDVSTNQRQAYETATNHAPVYDGTTDHRPAYDATTNQKCQQQYDPNQLYSPPPNQRPPFEPRHYESTNHRPERFENQRQYENQTNQRSEATNHRPPRLTSQDSQEMIYVGQQYVPYRNEEVTSPPTVSHHTYMQPQLAVQYSQAKVAPVAIPDPNIRPLSVTNVMPTYTVLSQGYPYVNQCRMDQQMQPGLYQSSQAAPGDKPLAPSPHAGESTFRIDPSYPYALEYAACGACGPPVDAHAALPHHRSFNVPYGPVELPPAGAVLPQAYPVTAPMLLPQSHLQPYPYQDQVQWQNLQPAMMPMGGKVLLHDLYPIVQYPGVYPQYNVVYPQMISQPYALPAACAPSAEPQRRGSFAGGHRAAKRDSVSGSSRTTPLQSQPEESKPAPESHRAYNPTPPVSRQNSNEIAVKIQQIKEQMAQLNTRERDGAGARGTEWKRRNSGHGILGSYPAGGVNGRPAGRPTNDESQLTTAARAIVNSIRSMQQTKSPYTPRAEQPLQPRQEYSPRWRRPDERRDAERPWRGEARGRGALLQYRPPCLLRQMSPGAFCRRSPGPIHPVLNHPRRPHPDTRNPRR